MTIILASFYKNENEAFKNVLDYILKNIETLRSKLNLFNLSRKRKRGAHTDGNVEVGQKVMTSGHNVPT